MKTVLKTTPGAAMKADELTANDYPQYLPACGPFEGFQSVSFGCPLIAAQHHRLLHRRTQGEKCNRS
jgi:hypothetical protein